MVFNSNMKARLPKLRQSISKRHFHQVNVNKCLVRAHSASQRLTLMSLMSQQDKPNL